MRYLLDTNTVNQLMRADPVTLARLACHGTDRIFISVITEAEIRFGLANNPTATSLHQAVDELWEQVSVLDFTANTAMVYGSLRAMLESSESPLLSPLDTLIAATALEYGQNLPGMVLVTNDDAFSCIPGLMVEDWTAHADSAIMERP